MRNFPKTFAALTLTTSLLASACALEEGEEDLEIGESESEITSYDTTFNGGKSQISAPGTDGARGVVQTLNENIYGVGTQLGADGRYQLSIRAMRRTGGGLYANTLHPNGSTHAWANAVAQIPIVNGFVATDQVFPVGSAGDGSTNYLLLGRIKPNASGVTELDKTFDGGASPDGVKLYNLSSSYPYEEGVAVAAHGGKLHVGGNVCKNNSTGHRTCRPFVARFDVNGAYDTTFGSGGAYFFPALEDSWTHDLRDLVVQSDGSVVVLTEQQIAAYNADETPGFFGLKRLNKYGTPDAGFGSEHAFAAGYTQVDSIALDAANDYIMVAGSDVYTPDQMNVWRVDDEGDVVETFGEGAGRTTITMPVDWMEVNDISVDKFGRTLIVASTYRQVGGSDQLIVRLKVRSPYVDVTKLYQFEAESAGTALWTGSDINGEVVAVAAGAGWGGPNGDQMIFTKVLNPAP